MTSVETEEDAERLLARTCERVTTGPDRKMAWLAPELEWEQSIENLYAFGARLEAEYLKMLEEAREAAPNR